MITFANGGRLIQNISELPNLAGAVDVYKDYETRSGDCQIKSVNPWHNCDALGVAITVDDAYGAWYIPISHYEYDDNLPREVVTRYLQEIADKSRRWINHNVKYDAHVEHNYMDVDLPAHVDLVDTITMAKLVNSDRLRYGLDVLSYDWLSENIGGYEAKFQPYLKDNKDYGWIPADLMAEYACQDVITNRRLWSYIQQRMHEQCAGVRATEIKLTRLLVKMERAGVRIDPMQIKKESVRTYAEMFRLDDELTKLTGRSFRPHVSADVYEVLCGQYGLPVLERTEEDDEETGEKKGNPSFNKHALKKYLALPNAPVDVVSRIIKYRKLSQRQNLFLTPYQTQHVDNVLHCTFNQCVRTGRVSCGEPNMTQLDKFAKSLILPDKGTSFLSSDYSQIEYRTIVHYIKDEPSIQAFRDDPDTDFHQMLADAIGISRQSAKVINFMVGFGGGKKKTLLSLSTEETLVESIKKAVQELIDSRRVTIDQFNECFHALMGRRAEDAYNGYHRRLPSLKKTARAAEAAARSKGYVYNLAGRHRHLSSERAHIAFNTVNQSSAADIAKERLVFIDEMLQGTPIEIVLFVHDEFVFRGPTEIMNDPRTVRDIVGAMEHPEIRLRVPIRTSYGISDKTWLEANTADKNSPIKKAELKLKYQYKDCQFLEWLK